jgi:hypothetical protein
MTNVQNVALSQRNVKNSTTVIQNDFYRPNRTFEPLINERIEALNTVLSKDFPLLNTCIWTTEWLNEWTIHQTVRTYTIVEVEDNACESVFYHLRDKGDKNVFLEPDALLMERYVSDAENPIIIQKLVGRSPLMFAKRGKKQEHLKNPLTKRSQLRSIHTSKSTDVKVPTLEKILVDIFCDNIVLFAYKGQEQDQIFRSIFNDYAIDMRTLFSYAERRKRKAQLTQYLRLKKLTVL